MNPRFEMYTTAGDIACQRLVDALVERINGDKFITEHELDAKLMSLLDALKERHGEVVLTEPRYHIRKAVNRALKARGYGYEIDL
jgi:hypothetical protein